MLVIFLLFFFDGLVFKSERSAALAQALVHMSTSLCIFSFDISLIRKQAIVLLA